MDFLVIQTLNGLASASSLFLVASGLSIIFGVTRIVNFAHGSFYMLGAYLAVTLIRWIGGETGLGFWSGVLLAAAVAVLGALIEITILRRIYHAPELFQLLATFGVVLMIQDLTLWIWGPEDQLGPRAPGLRSFVTILGNRFPSYELFLIFVGPIVLAGLWLLFNRTRWGTLVRAATQDREMVGALGVNQRLLFTSVFMFGAFLAGFGGALQLPREAVTLHMDLAMITEVFVVVVVGGLGSITGAYLAAVLIGLVHAFGIVYFPKSTLVLAFLVMAVVLVVKPYGLLGRRPSGHAARGQVVPEPLLKPADRATKLLGAAVLAGLVVWPPLIGDYGVTFLTELAILALFAASLHLMMGPGGMHSFGHAAYFGLGAYGAALAVKWFAAPMAVGLMAAPLLAGLAGLLFGWFCVRLSGVYLAMLTLAFAQIAWATAFQWVELTGGDNGILGVWPSAWAQPKLVFHYLALALCVVGVLALRHVIFSPFGYALRAGRDSPLRAEATGLHVQQLQWAGFTLAAVGAGLAGGLFAYFKGSVFPTYISIPKSVDALLMVLLGGVQTVSGPIVGAFVFAGLEEQLMRLTAYWRFALGLAIVLVVILFPRGIAGTILDWRARRSGGGAP